MVSKSTVGHTDNQGFSLSHISVPEFSGHAKFRDAAVYWHEFGFSVLPVISGAKSPAVKWDGWLKGLSRASIQRHWLRYPHHEVGFIVGDGYIVFDADSETAVSVLEQMEAQHGLEPMLIVKTKRGAHHYFRKDPTVQGKTGFLIVGGSDDRIDIKTGRTMVILPPSTNKVVTKFGGNHA